MTRSLCSECKATVDARIHFRGDEVVFDKYCPEHGHQSCVVASSVDWYLDALSFLSGSDPPDQALTDVAEGCPRDCGPCALHQQRLYLPVIPITSACNLDCPICYTVNKNEGAHMLSRDDFAAILDTLQAGSRRHDIINFSGGEPTLHPEMVEMLRMAREAGIGRLTVSTNGIKLTDESYLAALAEADVRVVLSLDTFDPAIDKKLLGANTVDLKLAVIDLLEKHDVTTTILPAVAAGLNDRDLPALLELVLSKPNVCSLEVHTLSFTGQGGYGFDRQARMTIPDVHRALAEATGGKIEAGDYVPSPLAHPHCYSICYLLMLDGGGYVPYTRLLGRERLYSLLADSIYIQPGEKVEEALRDALDRLWADPDLLPESEAVLSTLKRLLREMFPADHHLTAAERLRIAERGSKAIYIHSHMDEDNFDVGRVMKCCVGVPEADGKNIPTCAYNVLYRERDPRFADPEMLQRMRLGERGVVAATAAVGGSRSLPLIK